MSALSLPTLSTPWWVIQSRPRCEKKIQSIFADQSSLVPEVFLPCRPSRREYKSKSVTFQIPLFPGYLFARFDATDKSSLFQIAPVAGLIEIPHQDHFSRQLADLKAALENGPTIRSCPFIETGKKVRITSGRFKGIEGVVRRRSGKTKLILSIDILQQAVEVELEADLVALAA